MKLTSSEKILAGGVFAVVVLWSLYAFVKLGRPVEKWGVFGDKFGALNTLFTGLAFVGLLASLWHQREEAKNAREEAAQTIRLQHHGLYLHAVEAEMNGMVALLTQDRSRYYSTTNLNRLATLQREFNFAKVKYAELLGIENID